MMKTLRVAKLFNGEKICERQALVLDQGKVQEIRPLSAEEDLDLADGLVCPPFIDLQVYGGGGLLFSNDPSMASIEATFDTHRQTGTGYFQITLNCNPATQVWQAISACQAYLEVGGKGLIGLHLEGPFFNPIRRGAHKEAFVQAPSLAYIKEIIARAAGLPIYMTVAPEMFEESVFDYLMLSPIKVSIGHSDASEAQMRSAIDKGLKRVTHLFNAQSQWQSRALGIVGTTFLSEVHASIIPDGLHCDFQSLRLAKQLMGPRLFYITDAVTEDQRGPYYFSKKGDRFTDAQGTLSGSALTMLACVRNGVNHAGISLEESLRMAITYPAQVADMSFLGQLQVGSSDALLWISEDLNSCIWV